MQPDVENIPQELVVEFNLYLNHLRTVDEVIQGHGRHPLAQQTRKFFLLNLHWFFPPKTGLVHKIGVAGGQMFPLADVASYGLSDHCYEVIPDWRNW